MLSAQSIIPSNEKKTTVTQTGFPEFEPFVDMDTLVVLLGGIPKKTLYKWSSESRLNGFPAYKLGKHLRFRQSEVNSWILRRCLKSKSMLKG